MSSDVGPTVLLVEDDLDIVDIISRVLKAHTTRFGATLIAVSDGAAALAELARRDNISLVVTDYNIPGMNGIALTAAIKARSPTTKVLLITAYDPSALPQRPSEHGVDYFLMKPFSFAALEQIVDAALAPLAGP